MASTFTQNHGFELQATGDHNGTWGVALNAVISLVDQLLGASTSIATVGGASSITSGQLDVSRWNITGVLASNATLTIQVNSAAQAVSGYFIVDNVTTGAFSVTIANIGGGRTLTIPRGRRTFFFTDGTNVDPIETPSIIYAGTTAGTTTAYTATVPGSTSSLSQGETFMVLINATCGNQPTINLTMAGVAVGALALYKSTAAGPTRVATGELLINQIMQFTYDAALNGAAGGFHVTGGITPTLVQTFQDGTFKIQNTADATKQLVFDMSAFTTGHTTTIQPPDLNGTGIMVTTAATQTLTNKSLTSPIVTGSPTAAGATWADGGSMTTVDINGGTVDNAPIGATTRSTGKFTTLDASTSITVGSQTFTSVLIQGKETLWVPMTAMKPRLTQGATINQVELTTNKVNLPTLDFPKVSNAAGSVTYAQFAIQMPKSWNAGTVTFKPVGLFHVSTTSANAFVKLSGKAYAANAALDAAQGASVGVTLTGTGTIDQILYGAESAAITIGSAAAGPIWINFEFSRDVTSGSDSTANAQTLSMLGIHLYYTVNAADDT